MCVFCLHRYKLLRRFSEEGLELVGELNVGEEVFRCQNVTS